MNTHLHKGFTLIETLVAISILVLSVTGAFAAAQKGLSSATYSKNQIIAFYLADEGIEMIRNLRDQNALNGLNDSSNWLTGIAQNGGDQCYFNKKCMVDAVNKILKQCTSGFSNSDCDVLQQDPVNGFYGYTSGWTDTNFTREVGITSISPNEISVLVHVTWKQGTITRQFDVRENMLNWQ